MHASDRQAQLVDVFAAMWLTLFFQEPCQGEVSNLSQPRIKMKLVLHIAVLQSPPFIICLLPFHFSVVASLFPLQSHCCFALYTSII